MNSGQWRRASMQFDKIAASRMHLPKHVALSNLPNGLYRMVLKSSGINLECESSKLLLQTLDEIGAQEMLKSQPIGVRYSAVESNQKKRIIHGASKAKKNRGEGDK